MRRDTATSTCAAWLYAAGFAFAGCGSDGSDVDGANTTAGLNGGGATATTTGAPVTGTTTGGATATTASTTGLPDGTTTTTAGGTTATGGTTAGNTAATTNGGGDAGVETEPDAGPDVSDLEPFSFFVTSLEIMRELSGSEDGFGGDLGGLEGADSICQQAAAKVGFGAKTWRAFLSATDGGDGQPVHAIERIGEGPWYDRNGRLVAENVEGLLSGDRPAGDTQTVGDLPNEHGQGLIQFGDTHDVMTGSNSQGRLPDGQTPNNTCNDWTSIDVVPEGGAGGGGGFPWGGGGGFPSFGGGLTVGHSWPAMSGQNWIEAHGEGSCKPGVNLVQNGPGDGSSVGAGGGWGGIYCFALQP